MDMLIYNCPKCKEEWEDSYEEEYGECDDDCPNCGLCCSPRHVVNGIVVS